MTPEQKSVTIIPCKQTLPPPAHCHSVCAYLITKRGRILQDSLAMLYGDGTVACLLAYNTQKAIHVTTGIIEARYDTIPALSINPCRAPGAP